MPSLDIGTCERGVGWSDDSRRFEVGPFHWYTTPTLIDSIRQQNNRKPSAVRTVNLRFGTLI